MMDSTVNTGMCRCCASEGAFKDIKSSYHWMGEEEIYSDMLRECFDILLNVSEQGDDGGICEVCITQLRNAINFKKQVLHTEEQFQKHLQNKTLFRPNIVKVEVQAEDDSDDNLGSGDEGFSGNEYEVPIKTEADEPKTRKRAAKATATTTRASAKKAKAEAAGETSTKRTRDKLTKASELDEDYEPPWIKKERRESRRRINETEPKITKQRTNLREIFACSNATPLVGVNYQGYMCGYCDDQYQDPADLKKHTRGNHKGNLYNAEIPKTYRSKNIPNEYGMKLDITDLRCTLCDTDIDTLENLMKHLETDHKRVMHFDIKQHILPFKFSGDTMKCCMCPSFFQKFKSLVEHMRMHYRNYVCDVCDEGYVYKSNLGAHMARHRTGVFKCSSCPKTYLNNKRLKSHEYQVHVNKGMNLRCEYCCDRFRNAIRRDEHLAEVHGVKLKIVNCRACNKIFRNRDALRVHTRRDHLMERRFKCTECDKAFYQAANLKFHMVKHTKTREFQCTVCMKSYSRKETLRQHMEIHSDVRRFKCERCGQAFVQKASWKGHMKNKHDELV